MSGLTWLFLLFGATSLVSPGQALRELQGEVPAALARIERTALLVSRADPLTAPIRWALGHRPVHERAAEAFALASRSTNAALARALAAGLPESPDRQDGLDGAVASAALALTRSIRTSLSAPPGDSSQNHVVWRDITATLEALRNARLRVTGLALWQLLYLLGEFGVMLGFLAAGRALGSHAVPGHVHVAPTPLAVAPSRIFELAAAVEAWLGVLGPVGRFLRAEGIPRRLAVDLDRYFQTHARWPGSLKGHDAAPGGLVRHSLAVGRLMAKQAGVGPRRRAAVVLGVLHDLGKTVTYQPTPTGWTANPASPHDSLSARLAGQLTSFHAAFPAPIRRAILQALRDYHAPEAFAQNASPLARQLLQWLRDADQRAIAATESHDHRDAIAAAPRGEPQVAEHTT